MADGPVPREDSWVLLDGLDFENAGEYAASPPGGLSFTVGDEPPPYNVSPIGNANPIRIDTTLEPPSSERFFYFLFRRKIKVVGTARI